MNVDAIKRGGSHALHNDCSIPLLYRKKIG